EAYVDARVQEGLDLLAGAEGYEPGGWSKCNGCGYFTSCWPEAERQRDVALLPDVDQGLARVLNQLDCSTIEALRDRFDETRLAELQRPWGKRTQRVGSKARLILLQ